MGKLQLILDWLNAHAGMISTGLGMVWMVVMKVVSSDKAGKVVSLLQSLHDKLVGSVQLLAKGAALLAGLVQWLADLLENILKSDGFLGTK